MAPPVAIAPLDGIALVLIGAVLVAPVKISPQNLATLALVGAALAVSANITDHDDRGVLSVKRECGGKGLWAMLTGSITIDVRTTQSPLAILALATSMATFKWFASRQG